MKSVCGTIMKMWEITDVKPLWNDCCKDLGIDPRLVKPYFLPRDKDPDWFDPTWCQRGEAWWVDGYRPEVSIAMYGFENEIQGMLNIREIIYHELTHVVLQEAGEEEVTQLAEIINRRRTGWEYYRSYLKSHAFKRKLGPSQDSWTLFQWAKKNKSRFRKANL